MEQNMTIELSTANTFDPDSPEAQAHAQSLLGA